MKKRTSIWMLIALAALALVFAAGCDTSGDSASGGGTTTVTVSQVEELLKSIGDDEVMNISTSGDYWLFASGSMSDSAQSVTGVESGSYYVFSVADSNGTATKQAKTSETLSNLKAFKVGEEGTEGLLTADGNPCKIDFTAEGVAWVGTPSSTNAGYLKVTVELADGYSGSYTVPSSLETVYIAFTPKHGSGWASE